MHKIMGIVGMEKPGIYVEGLCDYRPLSVVSIMGRYRMIDFPLSNFSTSGINQIQVYIKEKPRSVIEHVGSTKQYNINSKHGKIHLLSTEYESHSSLYNNDIQGYVQNMRYIDVINADYVVIAPSYAIYQCDYQKAVDAHIRSGADLTFLYSKRNDGDTLFSNASILDIDEYQNITSLSKNHAKQCSVNAFLDTYICSKEMFKKLVEEANTQSKIYWMENYILDHFNDYKIMGYPVVDSYALISDLDSYYNASLQLNNPTMFSKLMNNDWKIYTQTNDSPPTRFGALADVKKSSIANGSKIEGTVFNSVIGRGVHIKKGAIVSNSIISANVIVEEGASIEHAVVDKQAVVHQKNSIHGNKKKIVYIRKYDQV